MSSIYSWAMESAGGSIETVVEKKGELLQGISTACGRRAKGDEKGKKEEITKIPCATNCSARPVHTFDGGTCRSKQTSQPNAHLHPGKTTYEIISGSALNSSSPTLTTGEPAWTTWMGVWKARDIASISGCPPQTPVDSTASQYFKKCSAGRGSKVSNLYSSNF